ncbi:protein sorting-associated protein 36 (Partial), partial [Seminavis robusta]
MPSTKLKRWSPMACLPVAALTPSGLLEMDVKDGEVELMRRGDMELRSDMADPMVPLSSDGSGAASTSGLKWIDRDDNLQVSLTTHRIVFFETDTSDNQRNARFLHLSHLHQVTSVAGGMMSAFSAPRLTLHSYMGDLLLIFRESGAAKDRDDLLKFLQRAMERKAWETQQRLQEKNRASQAIASRKVGVDAIITKSNLRHKEAARLTEDAFKGDAETLLREAAQLVKVIQKYATTLEKGELGEGEDTTRLSDMMENMGMTSALSRQNYRGGTSSSGVADDYTTTLARQLADFLRPRLKACGGLMTLTDIYCIYNRARGTNLISPEDLLDAAGCMKSLRLGMSERTFPSGVKVVQSDNFDDTRMAIRLKELAEEQLTVRTSSSANGDEGLTAMQVS